MPTTSDLINETRGHVYGSERQQLNALASDIALDDLTIAVQYPNQSVAVGGVISVGLELMYVWGWNPASLTVTVARGWQGSPQSTHSQGDIVTVNPRFSDFEILRALNNDLLDLSSPVNGLFQIKTETLEAVSAREGYDFPTTGFQSIADIRWQVPNSETMEWRPLTDYNVVENLPVETFPSGTAIFLNGQLPTPQQPIQVRYKAALGLLGGLEDDVVNVTGIPVTAVDLPPMGAALRIMAGRPIARAQYTTQGDTRRAAEVSTSDVVQAPTALRQVRQARLTAEATRLSQVWPFMLRSRDLMWPAQVN